METRVLIIVTVILYSSPLFLASNGYVSKLNVSYGPNPQQIVDLYLPENLTLSTKLVLFIHGGGWSAGNKEGMQGIAGGVASLFPGQAFANMNYRLGTKDNPGYPKQLDDINAVLVYIRDKVFKRSVRTTLVGASAGGHLSMLYGYRNGTEANVTSIVNIVGPADMTDPNIAYNPQLNMIFFAFIGPYVYCQDPELYKATSPVTWASAKSPPTISFFGKNDTLVPPSQATKLTQRLDSVGVPNQATVYQGGHLLGWTNQDMKDMGGKVKKFMDTYW